jgi:glycosyltransferase involved in cell wall biosynthesis
MVTIPPLSVVMPVRNALPYLDAAVESILGQTFKDFEFVIRDDDSTDGSYERLRFWAASDKRIRLFEGDSCLGPAGSSNWVVGKARAPIVARMDADDVALPHRFRHQLSVLNDNPDAVLIGSVWEGIDRQGRVVRGPDLSALGTSRFSAPFAHGSIMFRREAFNGVGGYRAECEFWEDLDLYPRMAALGRILVVVDPLYRHRFSETSTRLTSPRARVEAAVDLMFECRRLHERGDNYSPLLRRDRSKDIPRRHNPNTLLSLAFITLWSGLRPPTLIQLFRRGRLRIDRSTARALVWAAWAGLSPRTLRFIMRRRLHWKTSRVRRGLAGQGPYEWRVRTLEPASASSEALHEVPGVSRPAAKPNPRPPERMIQIAQVRRLRDIA